MVFIIEGAVIVIAAAAAIFLWTYTYALTGTVADIATHYPLANVLVRFAGHSSTSDQSGKFRVAGIKLWERNSQLQAQAPRGYEPIPSVKPAFGGARIANVNLTAEPTLKSLAQQLGEASINHQYDYEWIFMHPDSKSYWGNMDTYSRDLKKRDEIINGLNITAKSVSIGANIRKLDTWTDPLTGKTYHDVMEVPLTEVEVTEGREQPQTTLDYYQRVNGYYHFFTSVDKSTLEAALTAA